jgi:hypothetical protein
MTVSAMVSAPNSLVLIMDRSVGVVPDALDGLVGRTQTCVAIGTLAAADGETSLTIGDEDGTAPGEPVVDTVLRTPSGVLSVCSVMDAVYLEIAVAVRTRLRVWANHATEPDRIVIAVSPAPVDHADGRGELGR